MSLPRVPPLPEAELSIAPWPSKCTTWNGLPSSEAPSTASRRLVKRRGAEHGQLDLTPDCVEPLK